MSHIITSTGRNIIPQFYYSQVSFARLYHATNSFYGYVATNEEVVNGDEELKRSINESEEFNFESAFESNGGVELDGA